MRPCVLLLDPPSSKGEKEVLKVIGDCYMHMHHLSKERFINIG